MRALTINEERAIFLVALANFFSRNELKRLINAEMEDKPAVCEV